jgi:miniconductance mechanosensitive channel
MVWASMGALRLESLLSHSLATQILGLLILAMLCLIAHLVVRRWVVRGIERLVLRSKTDWDDVLHEARAFDRMVGLVPAVIGWYGIHFVPDVGEAVEIVVRRVAFASILLVAGRSAIAVLTAANELYTRRPENRDRPIKGYVQVLKLLVAIVTAVLILATLLDRSPLIFLSGLGAMTAVLLLIFRDTILSLVASAQITGNDMVRVGDWIEMPQYGADGDVIDVALHTVKVQNWDKTITTVPTHKLISDPFKNWRFMSLSGGRRIKRAIYVDMSTVRFLESGEIDRFEQFALLRDYVRDKRAELSAHNEAPGRNPKLNADIRRLTNLGTFRAYVERYLRAHSHIHQQMTLMVRQLDPGPTGIPIEIYCFTNTTNWSAYEGIQADLFDHLLAVAPEFGLRLFQSPTGGDVTRLAEAAAR